MKQKACFQIIRLGGRTRTLQGPKDSVLSKMWTAKIFDNSIFDFSNIEPTEVLLDFEGPQIYIFSIDSLLFLAYTSAIDDDQRRILLVTPITTKRIQGLKNGTLTIYGALDRDIVWRVDLSPNGQTLSSVILAGGINDIPQEFLPTEDALLNDEEDDVTVQNADYSKARVIFLSHSWREKTKTAAKNKVFPSIQDQASKYRSRISREHMIRRESKEVVR